MLIPINTLPPIQVRIFSIRCPWGDLTSKLYFIIYFLELFLIPPIREQVSGETDSGNLLICRIFGTENVLRNNYYRRKESKVFDRGAY